MFKLSMYCLPVDVEKSPMINNKGGSTNNKYLGGNVFVTV